MIARWGIAGLVLWLAVAVFFRTLGGSFFSEGLGGVSLIFLTAPLVIGVVSYLILDLMKVAPSDRSEAASVMAAAGLVIGLFEVSAYPQLFPDLPASLQDQFAALMFACVGAVVFVGLVSSRLESIKAG